MTSPRALDTVPAAAGPFHVPWGHYLPDLVQALLQTLKFTATGFVGATVLGLVVAVARLAPVRPVRWVAQAYTDVFRNLPLVTEIYILYFGLASVGIVVGRFTAGAMSLTLFYGAYFAEVFRAGLLGVQNGQREAAAALGLRPAAVFRVVVLPQAIRLALPGTTTMTVDLLKGTSLLVVIAGGELMTVGTIITSDTFRAMEVYVVVGAVYFALCYPLSQFALLLERRLHAGLPLSPRRARTRRVMLDMHRRLPAPPDGGVPGGAGSGSGAGDGTGVGLAGLAARGAVPAAIGNGREPVPAPEHPGDRAADVVIRVSGLTKSFGDTEVLRGVSLDIRQGSCVAVLGRSGGGKTTLLRCLNLLERPTGGSVEIEGAPVFTDGTVRSGTELVRLRQRVGMLFQSFNLFPHLSAAENVALPLIRIAGADDRTAMRQAFDLLDRVGLAHKAPALPGALSGGQQQRVAIARALALRPVALLFDEPTSALDPESTRDVQVIMRELCADGITMVVVTHDLPFADEVSDEAVFVDRGLIVERGAPSVVLRSPAHERTREFVRHYGNTAALR